MTRNQKSEKKRVLVSGADGRIAQYVIRRLSGNSDLEIFLLSRDPSRLSVSQNANVHQGDLTNFLWLRQLLLDIEPDRIIHAAAMTRPDACESFPEECERINIDAVRILAEYAQSKEAHITFLSSDFVFDGEAGPYAEEAEPRPINRYGQSKLRAETILQSANATSAILRGSFMYGRCPYFHRPDLFDRVHSTLSAGGTFQAPRDQFRTPTLAEDFAQAVCHASIHRTQGLFHIGSDSLFSVYEMVRRFAAAAGLGTANILPVTTDALKEAARRPLKVGLLNARSTHEFGFEPRSFEAGLAEWIRSTSEGNRSAKKKGQ